MAPFAQWDIVILPFPYSDRLAEKRRPSLVVSTDALDDDAGVLWVAMITSEKNGAKEGDVAIANLKKAGLPAPSLVRPSKLATIEPSRVLRRAGTLSAAQQTQVRQQIDRYLGWR